MTVTTPTSRLSVFVNGENTGDTVLLLHGGPGVPDYLEEVANSLLGGMGFDRACHPMSGIRASAVNGTRRGIGACDIYGDSKRYTFKRWPLARRVQMENAGHLPWIQQREAFVELLREFYGK